MHIALEHLIRQFPKRRVLIIGEAMLDVYRQGTVSRVAREAPVPVVDVTNVRTMPGGAANTAATLAQLGAQVDYVTVVGDDENGALVRQHLASLGVEPTCMIIDSARQTITKQRVTASDQTLVRFDTGTTAPLSPETERAVIRALADRFHQVDAVIVADYGYGTLTPAVRRTLHDLQRQQPTLLVVDPRSPDLYRDLPATVMKASYEELAKLLGTMTPLHGTERETQLNAHYRDVLAQLHATYVATILDTSSVFLLQNDLVPYRTYARPLG